MINNIINTIHRFTSCLSGRIEKLDTKTLIIISLVFNTFTLVGVLFGTFMTDDVSSIKHPSIIKVEEIDTSSENNISSENIIPSSQVEMENTNIYDFTAKKDKTTKVYLVDFVYDDINQPSRLVDRLESGIGSSLSDEKIQTVNKSEIMLDKEIQTIETFESSIGLSDNKSENNQANSNPKNNLNHNHAKSVGF